MKRPFHLRLAGSLAIILFLLASPAMARVWFVKQNATGANNGESWQSAFVRPDPALAAAQPGDEIWVAAATEIFGETIIPFRAIYRPGASASAGASFQLKPGVKLYGNFLGIETSLAERQLVIPTANPGQVTLLSGWPEPGAPQNSITHHVLRADAGAGADTVVDGFRIETAGTPGAEGMNAVGAGFLNEGGSPVFRNCNFTNLRSGGGSAVYSTGGDPGFINCVFSANHAGGGDGSTLFAAMGVPRLINCNVTSNFGPEAGVGTIAFPGTGEIVNSIIWNNTGTSSGIAGNPLVTYSIVQGGFPGAGNLDADPLLTLPLDGARLANGSPAIDAGSNAALPPEVTLDLVGRPRIRAGVRVDGSFTGEPRVDIGAAEAGGVAFVKPQPGFGGDGSSWTLAYRDLYHALTNVTATDAREYWVAAGTYRPHTGLPADRSRSFPVPGGAFLLGGFTGGETRRDQREPATNETILSGDIGQPGNNSDNSQRIVTTATGALVDGFTIRDGNGLDGVLGTFSGTGIASAGDATIRNCRFLDNRGAGGAAIWIGGTGIVERCEFRGNFSTLGAGALYLRKHGRVESSLFAQNQSDNGGAIFVEGAGELINCTIVNNYASNNGGGVWGSPSMINCIIWGNTAAFGGNQIFGAIASVHCIIQGGWPGSNIPAIAPGFANPGGNDFRLLPTSPAVDAGFATMLFAGLDAGGNARQLDGNGDGQAVVDVGAYEYGIPNRITGMVIGPGGKARINFVGTTNLTYSVEASGNLTNWTVLGTAVFSNGDFVFRDEDAPDARRRYYRTRLP
jgi:trimeric autotransporter adhesin